MARNWDKIDALIEQIQLRRKADPNKSYVARLLQRGNKKLAQKIAEEGAEVAIATVSEDNESIIKESADLLFHLLVLCEHKQIDVGEIIDELEQREGVSGLEEKANRDA